MADTNVLKLSPAKLQGRGKLLLLLEVNSAAEKREATKFQYRQIRTKRSDNFYLSPKMADVHFVFDSDGDNITRVPAHKHLLAVISDVFERMFYGGLKETGDVTIVDASAAVFKEFLQFFYLTHVKLSIEHMIEILYLGHKYNVSECIFACVDFLQDNVTTENVCAILTPAIFYQHRRLTEICDVHIKSNTVAVIQSSSFLACHREVLARILVMNLFSCSEIDVFEACMAWVRSKSEQKVLTKEIVDKYLGDLFQKMPFGSMTLQQFCTLTTKYNMVFRRDLHSISNMISYHANEPQSNGLTQWKNASKTIKNACRFFRKFTKLILLIVFLVFLVCNLVFNS